MKPFDGLLLALVVATTVAPTPSFAQTRHEPRGNSGGTAVARDQDRRPRQSASANQHAAARAVPRVYAAPQVAGPAVVHPYYYRPNYYYRPVRPYYVGPYLAPTYVFRPHTYLHFGVVLGYPVPYAYAYPYPVPVYGYGAPAAPVVVGPSTTQFGSIALRFSPPDASVHVDGGYAGLVQDFDGSRGTLTLTAGHHQVEISAPGFESVTLDVNAYPGQITPYQGSLRPY